MGMIADAFEENVESVGIAVRVRARHICVCGRGARKTGAETITQQFRGAFLGKPELQLQFMELLR